MTQRYLPFLGLLSVISTACGGGGNDDDSNQPRPTTSELAAPEHGIQLSMKASVAAGQEIEQCQFVVSPDEVLYLNRDEVRYEPGSHHFLLYRTSYSDIPAQKDDGRPVDTSGVFDCSSGVTDGWSVTDVIGGSQNPAGNSVVDFPPGVAVRIEPRTVFLLNTHYINTTTRDLDAEVRINLHTIAEEEVHTEGALLFWYDPFIKVPAQSSAEASMRCNIGSDVTFVNMTSHMHARGVGFDARLNGDTVYQTDLWENVPVKSFGAGMAAPAGSQLEFRCSYSNAEQRDVYQGPRSSDEMCVLIGSYYPADLTTTYCAVPGKDPFYTSFFGGTWTGTGQSSCPEVLGCIQEATATGLDPVVDAGTFQSITDCVMDAQPEIAELVSDGMRCLMTLDEGEDPFVGCQQEITACLSAR